MHESMEELVERVKARQKDFEEQHVKDRYSDDVVKLMFVMHEDMTEFMDMALTWMRTREDLERRSPGGRLS